MYNPYVCMCPRIVNQSAGMSSGVTAQRLKPCGKCKTRALNQCCTKNRKEFHLTMQQWSHIHLAARAP